MSQNLTFTHQNLKNHHHLIQCLTPTFPFPYTKTNTLFFHHSKSKHKPNSSPNIKNTTSVFDYLPGQKWWHLEQNQHNENHMVNDGVKPISLWYVVCRIWGLVAADDTNKRVIYIALFSLTLAAVSEISMPGLLAASIFAAQNGQVFVFYRNLKILVFLCFVSGICSGLRSGCFGVANMVLIKRLRGTLYKSLIFQDVSFFDREPVGNLTSRFGADCQRLSHIISNNLHLIVRNSLQIGEGKEEYTDDDLDEIREEWASYVANFIFRS